MKKINKVIEYVPIDNITDLNNTFYASATIITRKLAKNWKDRGTTMEEKTQDMQQDLSRVTEAMNSRYNDRIRRKIDRRRDLTRKGFQLVIEN